jgi:hypothetical protein
VEGLQPQANARISSLIISNWYKMPSPVRPVILILAFKLSIYISTEIYFSSILYLH